MKESHAQYWFPAKRYGWGWGAPRCWQGWAVFGVWLALLIGGAFALLPQHLILFFTYESVLVFALIMVCLLKGEKPRWRWGDDKSR